MGAFGAACRAHPETSEGRPPQKTGRQLAELQEYDDTLRHYADQRIALDLGDGVKVCYAKFGDLLAEVKAVTGGSDEE